jgi:xylan 1,4-beta-xylosidase
MIRNPILPGFNPDPSICRVREDYYIATSTFEWYPGVQIHHSRDLVNWTLVKRPLERKSQLDMRGNPDSCGVWAPCLSYADGLFWLVYTDVKRFDGNFKDAHNYIVTAPSVEGEWSDPVYVNSSGFDPSLFHDADGRNGSSTCSGTIARKTIRVLRTMPSTAFCFRNGTPRHGGWPAR